MYLIVYSDTALVKKILKESKWDKNKLWNAEWKVD